MNTEVLKKFQTLFESQKAHILEQQKTLSKDLALSQEDLLDEVDLTSTQLEQNMRIRLKNRQSLFLKKIEAALSRIKKGTFGECLDCEEPIEIKRLEARPTATLCVGCKEASERNESLFAHSRISRSKQLSEQKDLADEVISIA